MAAMMLPVIADTALNRIGTIDDYISFIWTRRYYAPGDFELCVPVNDANSALLKKDYYVMRDGIDDVGIIERVSIESNAENKQTLIASGRFLSSILARRIIANQIQVSGTVEICVKQLLNANAISPAIAARKIPGLQFGEFSGADAYMQQQFTGQNLLEAVQDICTNNELGMRVALTDENQFSFYMYSGVDRSYNQDENAYVVFSNEFDNLISSNYQENYESIVTDVLVAGEGEGTERKTVWANKTANSGLARYEMYQDARNASTNNGEISDSVYYSQLKEEGYEQITSFTQAFAGEVDWSNYELGTSVDVGDVVTIENTRWNIGMNARIVEIIESVNEAGVYTAVPTFAEPIDYGEQDNNAYLLTEPGMVLLSANNDALMQEGTVFDGRTSEYANAKRISELDETTVLYDSDFIPAATSTTTKKIAYSALKSQMLVYDNLTNKPEALTNSEIETMLK